MLMFILVLKFVVSQRRGSCLLSLVTLFKLLFSIAFLCKYKADVRVQCLEYVSIIFSLYRKLMNDNVNSVY